MKLPRGRLVRSRVVTDPRTLLVDALDRGVTGYAVLEPQESLLLDGEGRGVVTFETGVPVVAYHTGTERGGPPALADLAAEGPYQLELFELDAADLAEVHARESFRVPPGMAAERLVGDPALAERTREAAPADVAAGVDGMTAGAGGGAAGTDSEVPNASRPPSEADPSTGERGDAEADDRQVGAVEAFLDDEEKVAAIREEARAEAEARAEQWGFE